MSSWVAGSRRSHGLIGAREFEFLALRGQLDEIGWQGPERETLWRYNQHYFQYLDAAEGPALINEWLRENPPASGVGWEPYPTSLRIVNWVKWAVSKGSLDADAIQSLAVQVRWLAQRIEWHLLGNHLFANAKALLFAGRFFEGPEADRWTAAATEIFARELPEQILADGAQFERTPMYHALAVEDVLDLINLLTASRQAGKQSPALETLAIELRQRLPAMLRWMRAMQHPDGEISFFNDAAFDIAPTGAELEAYAVRLGFDSASSADAISQWLLPSGYARLEAGPAVALLDLAPIGPDYLPGHAHADTLSCELSLFGHRVLVNSGTSCYGTGPERHRQRGTLAHNTVVVDGEDSSEVWGCFRVARRARVEGAHVVIEPGRVVARGSHTGYQRLNGRPRHWRECILRADAFVVRDQVTPAADHRAVARFHLHPEIVIASDGLSRGNLMLPNQQRVQWRVLDGGGAWIESTLWHPRFGVNIANRCLCVELADGHSTVEFSWFSPGVSSP